MARSLLIITPYFAPQTHAAVFRAYKLAKHLALSGWNVHVLTVDRNYLYNEDPRMTAALPGNVTVHTARYVEPTLRGLRMWLGGRDRTFRAMKFDSSGSIAPERKAGGWPGRIYKAILQRINSPDVYWTWKRPAIRAAEKIVRDHGIEVIMTSSWPYTTLQIGAEVKRRTGVPWVADIRDPMTYERRLHSHLPQVFAKQKAIEKLAVVSADALTVTSSANLFILADMYGIEQTAHVRVIPTGVERDMSSNAASEQAYLIFVGEFLADYGDEFFRVFEEAAADPRVAGVRLKFVGRLEVNQARILPLIKNLKIKNNIDFVDHLPQQEVYKMIRASKAAVLCTSRRYPWWAAFAKLCDFVAHHKPVVAIVPDPSEARKWLQLSNLGIFLDGPAPAETLRRFLVDEHQPRQPVEEFCRTLYVEHQVAEFKRVFDECLGAGPRG